MKLLRLCLALLLCALFPYTSVASHISGGEIEVTHISGNDYLVSMFLYRNCSGITMPTTMNIDLSSSCTNLSVVAALVGFEELITTCDATGPTTCDGGIFFGIEVYEYQVQVQVPPCADWEVSWSTCCRSSSVNAPTSNGDGIMLFNSFNNAASPANSTPTIESFTDWIVCLNTPTTLDLGATDVDGDSLAYSFVAPLETNVTTPLLMVPPYSGTNPIDGITIDPLTGIANFTPTTMGAFILGLRIDQYDSTGTFVGYVIRDLQVSVENCAPNLPPNDTTGVITNMSGATQLGSYEFEMCQGSPFSFDIAVSDPDFGQTVSLSSDIDAVLPGAGMTVTPGNPATATISWTGNNAVLGTHTFEVVATDANCPILGAATFTYTVTIAPAVSINPAASVCVGDTAFLTASSSGAFNWSTLYGTPLQQGVTYDCLNTACSELWVLPDTISAYSVTGTSSAGCPTTDTVVVAATAPFAHTITQSDTLVCNQSTVSMALTPQTAGTYSYQWDSNAAYTLSNNNTATVDVFVQSSGTVAVTYTATNANGCAVADTGYINVASAVVPQLTVIADTLACGSDSTQLLAWPGTGPGFVCNQYGYSAIPFAPIPGAGPSFTMFDDQVSSTLPIGFSFDFYCNTYSNFYIGANGYISFDGLDNGCCAGELIPTPFGTGTNNLVAVAWTDLNPSLGGTFDYFTTGSAPNRILVVNFNAVEHNGGIGSPLTAQVLLYEIDGSIEIHTTSFGGDGGVITMGIEDVTGTQAVAVPGRNATDWSAANDGVRFALPGIIQDYNYQWSPATGLSSTTTHAPFAGVTAPVTYTVIATDTSGLCADTASIALVPPYDFGFTASQSDSILCLYDAVAFDLVPSTSGNFTFSWTDPNGFLGTNNTVANPTGVFYLPGAHSLPYAIASDSGCTKTGTFNVMVAGAVPVPQIVADTGLCFGDTVLLDVAFVPPSIFCNYTVTVFDSVGDGWGGAELRVHVNGSLNSIHAANNGLSTELIVVLSDGDLLSLEYIAGGTDNENSYQLADQYGNLLFADGPGPAPGVAYTNVVACGSTPNLTYEWLPPAIIDNTNAASTLAYPTAPTTFSLLVVDTVAGCSGTDTLAVNVEPHFTVELVAADSIGCLLDSMPIQALVSVPGTYNFAWQSVLPLIGTGSDVVASIATGGTYQIDVIASTAGGCSADATTQFIVADVPLPNASISSAITTLCDGETAQLIASPGQPSVACEYTLEGYDTFGDGWSGAALTININGLPADTFTVTGSSSTVTIPVLNGDIISLDYTSGATPGEESYLLFDPNGTLLFADGPLPLNGTNVFFASASCGIDPNAYTYSWIEGTTTLSSSSGVSPTATPTVGTTSYTVVIGDSAGYCLDTATIDLLTVVTQNPAITTNPLLCQGALVTLTAVDSGGNWSLNGVPLLANLLNTDSLSGNQQLVYELPSACGGTDTLQLVIDTVPAPTAFPAMICLGESALLAGAGPVTIIWFEDSALTDTLGVAPVQVPGLTANTTFWGVAVGNNNCVSDPTALPVTVLPLPAPAVITGSTTTVLEFETDLYTVTPLPGHTYTWTAAGGIINAGQGTDSLLVLWLDTGLYEVTVVVTDVFGCQSDTATYPVEVFAAGIDDIGSAYGLQLQPNPMNSSGMVRISDASHGKWQLRLFNELGQLVYTARATGNTAIQLNTAELPAGMYFLQASGPGVLTKRIQVVH